MHVHIKYAHHLQLYVLNMDILFRFFFFFGVVIFVVVVLSLPCRCLCDVLTASGLSRNLTTNVAFR